MVGIRTHECENLRRWSAKFETIVWRGQNYEKVLLQSGLSFEKLSNSADTWHLHGYKNVVNYIFPHILI